MDIVAVMPAPVESWWPGDSQLVFGGGSKACAASSHLPVCGPNVPRHVQSMGMLVTSFRGNGRQLGHASRANVEPSKP